MPCVLYRAIPQQQDVSCLQEKPRSMARLRVPSVDQVTQRCDPRRRWCPRPAGNWQTRSVIRIEVPHPLGHGPRRRASGREGGNGLMAHGVQMPQLIGQRSPGPQDGLHQHPPSHAHPTALPAQALGEPSRQDVHAGADGRHALSKTVHQGPPRRNAGPRRSGCGEPLRTHACSPLTCPEMRLALHLRLHQQPVSALA